MSFREAMVELVSDGCFPRYLPWEVETEEKGRWCEMRSRRVEAASTAGVSPRIGKCCALRPCLNGARYAVPGPLPGLPN